MTKNGNKGLKKLGDYIVLVNGGASEVRMELKEYKGRKFLDIRKWYREDVTNNMLPTSKGIALANSDVVKAVKTALVENEKAILGFLG